VVAAGAVAQVDLAAAAEVASVDLAAAVLAAADQAAVGSLELFNSNYAYTGYSDG
jgi:hypothetical protein